MYSVYKIKNKINQKTYIGVHRTTNPYDSYMGSGIAIRNAIKLHGKDNFEKEILLVTEDKKEAYDLERELTVDFHSRDNYNMKLGGVGGFTKEDSKKGHLARSSKGGKTSVEQKKGYHALTTDQLSENGRKGGLKNKGKPKSEEHKRKIRETWAKKKQCAGSTIG